MNVPAPHVVFAPTFEGLFHKGLLGRVTPRLGQRLLAAGIDLRKLAPAYPEESWAKAVRIAAEEVYPQLPFDEAAWRLGEDSIRGFSSTMIGQATIALLKVVGPKRALTRIERSFGSGNNYLETKVTERGPADVEIWFSDVHQQPGLYGGILRGVAALLGAKSMSVDLVSSEGAGATFRLRWVE